MAKLQLNRRQTETALLALLGLIAIGGVRYPVESLPCFSMEMLAIVMGFVVVVITRNHDSTRLRYFAQFCLIATPIAASVICRQLHSPIAFEMTALTVFGAVSLGLSILDRRPQSMSVVGSGFLTLFATVISDHPNAVAIGICWIMICVWHLVANHWERIELCSVDNVTRRVGLRPFTVVMAVGLFAVGGLIAKDRFGNSSRFAFGIMPTSGGSDWSDPGALSGVGTGEAAVAGKDSADSFGAVESEIFLESTESTLFDMFSDSIGQPKKKTIWERRQGMSSEKVLEAHGKTSKSEKGGSSFSTDRMPPEKHSHLKDAKAEAMIQWSGRTGIRLAMNRYDSFDSVEWTNQARHGNQRLMRKDRGDQVWFFDPKSTVQKRKSSGVETREELLKVIRLNSTRLPVPGMSHGVHIKDIDRQDFYAIDDDGSFIMPARKKIPALTVVHVMSQSLLEDELLDGLRHGASPCDAAPDKLRQLVEDWTVEHPSQYEKLRSIVNHLRHDFQFDRSVEHGPGQPLNEFLETRVGGDHLFATTAVLMAREIGLPARLVTGFYVRPSAFEVAAGHSDVLASDVHVWAEVALQDGRWFEIEPTPGFREPRYEPSLWLASQRFAALHWPTAAVIACSLILIAATRLIWIEWIVALIWWLAKPLQSRRRLQLAMRIIEFRAGVLRHARPDTLPQREWLLDRLLVAVDQEMQQCVRSVCDLADQLCFGGLEQRGVQQRQLHALDVFVGDLPIRTLKKHLTENA